MQRQATRAISRHVFKVKRKRARRAPMSGAGNRLSTSGRRAGRIKGEQTR